jgi:hypothetical protein
MSDPVGVLKGVGRNFRTGAVLDRQTVLKCPVRSPK